MKKKLLSVLLATTMTLSLAACSSNSSKDSSDKKNPKVEEMSFDDMKKEAKGSTVTFYGWGGDEVLNKWLDDVFAPDMKEKYDIKMERVPMDIDQILSQLSGEMEGKQKRWRHRHDMDQWRELQISKREKHAVRTIYRQAS